MKTYLAFAGLAVVMAAGPAFADRPAYCAAYARDFANAATREKILWQHKYDISLQACLAQAKPKVVAVLMPSIVNKTPPPVVAEAVPPEPLPLPAANRKVKLVATMKTVLAAPVKIVQGSDDWNAYCAQKYTSFDSKKGTYLSRTGVERKCLVTAP